MRRSPKLRPNLWDGMVVLAVVVLAVVCAAGIWRGSGSQETVTVQEIYPRYQGALLVCAGGDDPTVRLQLTEAMSALTGLGADKISISQGK